MKKIISIVSVIAGVLFMASLILYTSPVKSSPKSSTEGKPIPENIMKIAEKSCVKCHTEPGNPMAISHINLSNWNKYSLEKQAEKASKMCTMVTKEKMPPKKFREENPKDVPTAEELKALCDWAASLQPATK